MATVEKCGLDDAFARGMSRADVDRLIVDRLPDLPSTERAALRPVYRYMSAVTPQRVEWLWDGYIVRRKLNLLAGYGGVGKGQMSCSLIARLSRGDPLPNSDHRVTARTLILAAEDSPEEDLWWRLTANGADMDNIIILDGMAASDGVLSWVDVQKHASAIAHVIRTESIDLLYIDPASSYMPGTDRNSQGAVRDALGHVQRIINDTGVTVLATVHLGKAAERKGAQRILGSVEIVNLARNVLAINDLPDEHQPAGRCSRS
jgi:RecA-family ATPase